jgi:hypothetical protein
MGRPEIVRLFAFCDLHTSRWRTWPVVAGFVSRPMYYDREGFPIPAIGDALAVLVWARMMEGKPGRHVAADELPDGSHLSTVWLGLDHAYMGAPLIFETMRFAPSDDTAAARAALPFPDPFGEPDEETEQLRYTTEEEALAAHHEIRRRLVLRLGS